MKRTIRSFYILFEIVTFLVISLMLLFLFIALQRSIRGVYGKMQISEIHKIEMIIEDFLKENRDTFKLYLKTGDKMGSASLLQDFSDIYYVSGGLRISRIIKKDPGSQIFAGYDLGSSRLGEFVRGLSPGSEHSSQVFRSPENDKLSLYLARKKNGEALVVRIGLEKMIQYLRRVAEYTDSVVLLTSTDGLVLSSSRENFPLYVLPADGKSEITLDREYLLSRKVMPALNSGVAILTPMTEVYVVLQTIQYYYPLFIAVVALILMIKVGWQFILFWKPLRHFITLIQDWELEKRADKGSPDFTRYEEMEALYQTFHDKASQIQEAVRLIRQNEAEMSRMRHYLKNLVDSMPSMLISVNEEGNIVEWNEAAGRFTGISAAEAIGKKFYEVVPYLRKYEEVYRSVITQRQQFETKRDLFRNGHERYVNMTMFPLVRNGVEGMAIRLDDITDLEKAEQQLRQSQKMEIIGTLAGGLAHDFNNVLGGIMGTVSLMQFQLRESGAIQEAREEWSGYLDILEEASRRASEMVAQLLTLSRKQESNFSPVDLNQSLRHVLKICQSTLDKSVELDFTFLDNPALVMADPTQIEQVILNLCINAAHAMTIMRGEDEAQGGQLSLSLKWIDADSGFALQHPDAMEGFRYWILSVQDNGVGMTTKTAAKVFDPFFTTKEKGRGTGLGLSMVYNIVQLHKGFIDVYSEPGSGSVFNVYLPVLEREGAEGEIDRKEAIRSGEGLILVVDDEAMIRNVARDILETCGYTVLLATDGEEGLSLYRERFREIRLVLLDLAMPKKSGLDTYIEMRRINENVRVLLTSGFKQDEKAVRGFNLGINGFIQKPYTVEALSRAVYQVLNDWEEEGVNPDHTAS